MPKDQFASWGWRIPFLLSFVVIITGYIIRRQVDETPAFSEEQAHGEVPASPVVEVLRQSWDDVLRVVCMALTAVIVLGNICSVILIPFVGNLSDKIGRRPPVLAGVLSAGLLSFAYLYAISIHNLWLSLILSVLMWGIAYQGFNGVFPSLFPELFRTRVRVSGMAIGQNVGTTLAALTPTLFVAVAPPGSANIPLKIGFLTFGICLVAAFAAFTTRETYRIRLNDLGDRDAVPVSKAEYERLRGEAMAGRTKTADAQDLANQLRS
jgi:MFS family permease